MPVMPHMLGLGPVGQKMRGDGRVSGLSDGDPRW